LIAGRKRSRNEGVRPDDLRHSYASLRLWESCSLPELVDELGHSPTITPSTYAHVIAELKHGDKRDAEAAIRAARATVFEGGTAIYGPPERRCSAGRRSLHTKRLQTDLSRRPDSNRGPLHYEDVHIFAVRCGYPSFPSLQSGIVVQCGRCLCGCFRGLRCPSLAQQALPPFPSDIQPAEYCPGDVAGERGYRAPRNPAVKR
jgi:hypothetical protein